MNDYASRMAAAVVRYPHLNAHNWQFEDAFRYLATRTLERLREVEAAQLGILHASGLDAAGIERTLTPLRDLITQMVPVADRRGMASLYPAVDQGELERSIRSQLSGGPAFPPERA